MAIMDKRNEFCDATAVGTTAGTNLLGNQIDAEVVRDLGNGQPVYLCINVDTSIITGGTAGTIQFQLVSDAQAAIAVDGSATVHWASKLFVTDDDIPNDLDAGEIVVCIALPTDGGAPYERYLGILSVIATTTITAGKINAWLSLDPIGWKSYADAVN